MQIEIQLVVADWREVVRRILTKAVNQPGAQLIVKFVKFVNIEMPGVHALSRHKGEQYRTYYCSCTHVKFSRILVWYGIFPIFCFI